MSATINYFQSIKTEWMKSRSVSVRGLIAFCIILVVISVILANYMDVYNRVSIDTNPWRRYFVGGMAIYVLFVMAPFLILLTGAITYIEEKANGWKFMYTLDISRTQTYLSKLAVVVFLVLLASLILGLLIFVSGYVLGFVLPEYEFSYYTPDISYLLEVIVRAMLSCLGAIGLQYMISIMTNNVILSLGIGIFGYIVGFILAFSDTSMVLYNPYALVMIDQDFGAVDSDYKKYLIEGVITNVEVWSIGFFVLFTTIGCIYETRKNIK